MLHLFHHLLRSVELRRPAVTTPQAGPPAMNGWAPVKWATDWLQQELRSQGREDADQFVVGWAGCGTPAEQVAEVARPPAPVPADHYPKLIRAMAHGQLLEENARRDRYRLLVGAGDPEVLRIRELAALVGLADPWNFELADRR